MKKITLSWIFLGSLLLAQPITKIQFDGLAHLSSSTAMEIANIHIGENVDAIKINQSIRNFFAQGYFEDVWVDREGSTLIYHFKEKKAIANVSIKGYGSGDDGEKLLDNIGLKKGDLYDHRRISRAKKSLISKLEAEGFYDTVAEVSTNKVSDNSVAVSFDVNKGEKIKIKKMHFIGAKKLSQSTIEFELANKEEEFLGWMPFMNNGVAKIDQLEYDALRVKEVYMKHGFLDVKVAKPLMRVDFGSYGAEVEYQIKEGKQYRVGEVTIAQKVRGLHNKVLLKKLKLRKGTIFNIQRMRKDMAKLTDAIGNLGYAYAHVVPRMQKNPETGIVNVSYVFQSGKEVVINDVLISGNNSTKDRVIRRYLYLAPGDKYNATDLKDSKNALGRTGFFEDIDIQTQRTSADKVNLLVKVKEAPTGSISLGGGYGSFEGPMLNASYSEKNTFGTGISTNVGFDISKISTNYNLSFSNPKLWDSKNSLGFSLYKKNYQYPKFIQDQTGGTLTLGREFARYFRTSIGLGYVDNQSERNDNNSTNSGYTDNSGTLTEEEINLFYRNKYKKTSLYTSLSFNNTDDFYMPREGMIAAVNFEFAGLSGTLEDSDKEKYPRGYGKYIKSAAKLALYYGLEDWINYDLILRFKAKATNISGNSGEKIPVAEKLFMGGMGSVRGFRPYSLTPRDNGLSVGGKKRASLSVEASIPLSKAAKMRLAAFYDYGMIGEENFNELTRSSVGLMLEWQSPMGPINLIFAKALDDEKGDRKESFEFSMGTRF